MSRNEISSPFKCDLVGVATERILLGHDLKRWLLVFDQNFVNDFEEILTYANSLEDKSKLTNLEWLAEKSIIVQAQPELLQSSACFLPPFPHAMRPESVHRTTYPNRASELREHLSVPAFHFERYRVSTGHLLTHTSSSDVSECGRARRRKDGAVGGLSQ